MARLRLKQARLEAGLTQSQLAELLDVSPQAVMRWEKGDQQPQPHLYGKIRDILHSEDPLLFEDVYVGGPLESLKDIMDLIRRHFNDALFTLFGASALTKSLHLALVSTPNISTEEYLAQCGATLKTCWVLFAHGAFELVENAITTHVPTLTRLAYTVFPEQSIAASLAVEAKILESLLYNRNMQFRERALSCEEAVKFAAISGDSNLHAIALDWLGNTYTVRQPLKAIPHLNEALTIEASPLVQSAVYSDLAIASALDKTQDVFEKNALIFIEKSYLSMPIYPELDPSYQNIRLNPAELDQIAGQTYLHLAERLPHSDYGQMAYKTLEKVSSQRALDKSAYLRALVRKADALRVVNELNYFTDCLTEGMTIAGQLNSKRRYNQIHTVLRHVPLNWQKEKKIQDLQKDVSQALIVARS